MARRPWTINGRFLTQRTTGVQRYAREIVTAIDLLIAEGHPLAEGLAVELLVPSHDAKLAGLRAIETRVAKGLPGPLWDQVTLTREAIGGLMSLGNTSTVFRGKQIVCIHDVNVFLVPQSYSFSFRLLYRLMLPLLGRVADTVVTVSRFSADQIAQNRIAPAGKIMIAPNGHEHVFRWGSDPNAGSPAADRDTIVVLGSLAPHKNLATLLRLLPSLAESGLKLAIVGNVDGRIFGATELDPRALSAEWLGPLSDPELADLLSRSLCLAFPSLMEGFGLPALEAMALGCPVIVSDRASLPEVCSDAALYASALAPEVWLERFLALRDDPALRDDLIRRGRERAREFSWRRSAETYLRAMAKSDGFTISTRSLSGEQGTQSSEQECSHAYHSSGQPLLSWSR